GVCRYQLGDMENAVKAFEAAVRIQPKYNRAYYALGMASAQLQHWTAAEEAFMTALKINDRDAEAWFDLAYVFFAKDDLASARSAFEKSLKYKTVDSSIAHNNIGVLAALDGDLALAEAEFQKALLLTNNNFRVARDNLVACRRQKVSSSKMPSAAGFLL